MRRNTKSLYQSSRSLGRAWIRDLRKKESELLATQERLAFNKLRTLGKVIYKLDMVTKWS